MPVANNSLKDIELLKETLSKKFNISQIIVFGSFAYGTPHEDSDIDICVITDFSGKRRIEIIREMRRELSDLISSPLDILVYNEEEFDERARLRGSLEHKILTQGLKIYDQPGISARMV